MSKEKKQNRVELLVESIAVEKQIIDEYCDDLITARDSGDNKGAKEVAKKLEPQIKRYNGQVNEYNKLTGEKVAPVSQNLAEEIMAGKTYHGIAAVGNSTVTASAYSSTVNVLNQKELAQYIAKSDKALENVRTRLATTVKQKDEMSGYNKVLLIINCLTYQRYIIERLSENLAVCCQLSDEKRVKSLKKTLDTEIATYNEYVNEYAVLTGARLTYASTSIPADIIAGKAFTPIPAISYTAGDGTTRNSDAEVAAVAAAAAAAADKANKKAKKNKKNKGLVQKTALEEKVAEQANKDLAVLTKASEYEVSHLEVDKDMSKYKFGLGTFDMKKRKANVDKNIKAAKKQHKEALKCENADNARYYAVITNDPATMVTKKRKADRAKIASVRAKMMTLLNKRDEINSKLLSIYGATEVNLDGTSVNQKWREIKSNTAEKTINKNKALASKVSRLPASQGEKQRLYNLMNQNVDAISTTAVLEYRLKKKEYVSKQEKKSLQKDIKNQKATVKQNSQDIKWIIAKINKRA